MNPTVAEIRRDRRLKQKIQKASVGIATGLVFFLTALACFLQKKYQDSDPSNTQSARLIEKKEGLGMYEYRSVLFYDRDGQTNTAEAICFVSAKEPAAMEALRQIRVGQEQTVGKWKSDLNAIFGRAVWQDIKQRRIQ